MSTLSRRTFSLSAMGMLSAGLLAACGTESEDVDPTVTREPAEGAPPTNVATVEDATPAASASTPGVAPSDGGVQPQGGGDASPPAVTGVESLPTSATITFVDLAFDPPETTIAAGVDVTFNFTNGGALPHGYKIDDPLVESKVINGGETDSLTVNLPAGTYDSYCPVPGHKEAGMVGKLIVQ